jgi:mono/diheme cytochrome c family protein
VIADLSLAAGQVLAVSEEPIAQTEIGIGAVVITLAIAAFLIWASYLVLSSRRSKQAIPEETPRNLQPGVSDDEMENKRLTRVLGAAVISAAALAAVMGIYYANEPGRQVAAAEEFVEVDLEEGHKWFEKFVCVSCHGADGGGGVAEYVEARSGLTVSWTAPSINDVFYRYDRSEIEFWIVYGRQGSPMPASGLEGGGAMTVQEVSQVIDYVESLQIPQAEALNKIDGLVDQALSRLDGAETNVARLVIEQEATIADIRDASTNFAFIDDFPTRVRNLLAGSGNCTSESAALVGASCRSAGVDSDRDGLTDVAELELSRLSSLLTPSEDNKGYVVRSVVDASDADIDDPTYRVLPSGAAVRTDFVQDTNVLTVYGLELDPTDAFTVATADGTPIPDLEEADAFLNDIDGLHLRLSVTSERQDRFIASAEASLEFLEDALTGKRWSVDFTEVLRGMEAARGPAAQQLRAAGDEMSDVLNSPLSIEDATRAVGLYNAYCARCHTAGYSAGPAIEQEAGSGAWAPALNDGRSVVQFPEYPSQVDFILNGSELGKNYGVNGIGRGWMPGFGQLLSQEDIDLIILYERSL